MRTLQAKLRTLMWATLAALVVGLLGLAEPLEEYARMARNRVRMHPPSGQVVIAGIDDRAVAQFGSWPWRRDRFATIVDNLTKAGAKRIYFDVLFYGPDPGDNRFADALQRSGRVYLGVTKASNLQTDATSDKLPHNILLRQAEAVSLFVKYTGRMTIPRVPYATRYEGRSVQSMASHLANKNGPADTNFMVDYSINSRQIPTISVADILNDSQTLSGVAGKDVVIGVTSRELGDLYFLPGYGLISGVYVQAIAADTLKSGTPINYGWWLPTIMALVLSLITTLSRRVWQRRMALSIAILAIVILPFWAEANLVFLEVLPATVLVCWIAFTDAWANFRNSYKVRGAINAVSGLPNLNALRAEQVEKRAVLVAARITNYAEISSTLPPDAERTLVNQIVSRLALGARGAKIFQGDEGTFVWSNAAEITGPDQLDALHALFRSPALVDGRSIDLSIAFGIDSSGDDRNLANRIGATLVAADEAAAEGLRWKAYDPAKLADAEWKLSLLGRLDAAIDTGEIWVAYQPQLDLATGRISGAEALVRWSHPEKGEVSPAEFVLAAEQHNRIDKLTQFVLSDAVKLASAYHARGIALDVSVNISPRLLESDGLVALIQQHLTDSGLPPARLTLEVTESAAMSSGDSSIRTLEKLGSLGVNVSIDDYGTGFSTLEYFKKIPATEVKIDQGFVASIDRVASDRLMVRSTIEMAHSLGRSVVAEGVESAEILAELTNLGCDKAQGYYIGRPMKAMRLTKLILDQRTARAA